MESIQKGILRPLSPRARYLSYSLQSKDELDEVSKELIEVVDGSQTVLGIGQSLVSVLGQQIEGLRVMPAQSANGLEISSTPAALWLWLRGDDPGELLHRSRGLSQSLSPAFELEEVIDGFVFADSRDLTGYIDGTENPEGDAAINAAFVTGQGKGMDGSSFVAVQQWRHEFDVFELMSQPQQDDAIGRHKANNEEFDAPASAHVKRTAQEDFSPEAFILRRSMPWVEGIESGLNFVAFGHSFKAFEAQLQRMLGLEDGISDAIFKFTRPINGAYYWCPPMKNGRLDLSLLGY